MGEKINADLFEVYLTLLSFFGKQNWWPIDWNYHLRRKTNPFDEIVIGAVLTQNTSWKNVERSLERFKEYGELSLRFVEKIPLEELHFFVQPTGFYRQKSIYLKEVAKFIRSLKGAIPKRGDLLRVKGIGKETADVILLYAYNVPSFVIDRYTLRWLERFIGRGFNYDTAKGLFEEFLPKNVPVYKEFHALLDELGKNFCLKREPKCDICPLRERCLKGKNLKRERGW